MLDSLKSLIYSEHSLVKEKNSTFSNLAFLVVQVGRQNIPVVFTSVKKTPSNNESFSTIALYIISDVNSMSFSSNDINYSHLYSNGRIQI